MTDIKVARTSEIAPGTMLGIEIKGTYYLIASVNGEFYAMDGTCSHRGGSLWKGVLTEYVVQCPRHGSRFDIRTGKVVGQVKIPLIGKAKDLKVHTITIKEGDVYLDI